MTFKCIIVDDEDLARGLIRNHLSQLPEFEIVGDCKSALDASKILSSEKIDVMFLDIEMPVLRGTEFLRNLVHPPHVIFTTAYRDYAVDGFDLNAVDYLLKPITFGRFFKAIEKFKNQHLPTTQQNSENESRVDFLFIRSERKQVKVNLEEITYIESIKDYIHIHSEKGTHITKQPISKFMDKLDNRFIRIHRSFIVQIGKITAFTKHDIEICEKELPIGETYKENVEAVLS